MENMSLPNTEYNRPTNFLSGQWPDRSMGAVIPYAHLVSGCVGGRPQGSPGRSEVSRAIACGAAPERGAETEPRRIVRRRTMARGGVRWRAALPPQLGAPLSSEAAGAWPATPPLRRRRHRVVPAGGSNLASGVLLHNTGGRYLFRGDFHHTT